MNFEAPSQEKLSNRSRIAPTLCSVLLLAGIACNSRHVETGHSGGKSLDSGIVASVGQRVLTCTQVTQEHFETSDTASTFVRGWVDDALVAEGARTALIDRWRTNQAERSVLARALLEKLYGGAIAGGAPTDAEISKMTAERWFAVDRPSAAKVSHFVVRIRTGESENAARQLARRISSAVHAIAQPKAFIDAAKEVPSSGFEVVAESLPPMTADGRGLQLSDQDTPTAEGPTFEPTFARAANALESVGSQSGLVRTPFGFHVLLLERKLPVYQMPLEERRRAFASDILVQRARRQAEQYIEWGKAKSKVAIEPGFQEILEKSRVLP